MHKCDGCKYKGEHHQMPFRKFGVCLKEFNLIKAEKSYNAEKCPYIMLRNIQLNPMTIREVGNNDDAETVDRKECPMRHENGNCLAIGGFCTAVNNEICEALYNAYGRGVLDAIKS